jgi:hypothetical protein
MIGPTNKNNSLFIMFINPKYWNGKLLQWNRYKPNLLGTNFCASYIRTLSKCRFIQDFGLYRISVYTGFQFIQVQFIQDFGLFWVRFRQVSLYFLLKYTNYANKTTSVNKYLCLSCSLQILCMIFFPENKPNQMTLKLKLN